MPQQKMFQADPTNPVEIEGLFGVALDLAMDGWGATVKVNPDVAVMTTNAPMAIINFHMAKQLV
jgi:hypothetical protein